MRTMNLSGLLSTAAAMPQGCSARPLPSLLPAAPRLASTAMASAKGADGAPVDERSTTTILADTMTALRVGALWAADGCASFYNVSACGCNGDACPVGEVDATAEAATP